jgi:hypothetical protein
VPYAGLGFRYLYNDLRGTSSTGAIGYRRESHYFYVPLGVTLRVPLAFLASFGLLSLYRRAVVRVMRARAHGEMTESMMAGDSGLPQEPVKIPLNIVVLDPTSTTTNNPATEGLYANLLGGPWRAAAVYAMAGLCYALVTTIIFLIATNSGFQIVSFLIIFWYYAWPVVITICLVAASTWRVRLLVIGTYFLLIIVLGVIASLGNSMTSWTQIVFLWFLTNFPAALVLLAFLNRRIQAVGPLLLTLIIFAVTGAVLLPPLAINDARIIGLIVDIGVAVGLGGFGIYIALLILGFSLFGAVGWLVLQKLTDLYQRRKVSAQSITIDAIWLLFGIFQSVGLIFEGERWFLISLFAFVVYKIAAWAGFSIANRRVPSSRKATNLLLLRVFALGKRSERLFDLLAMYWRYIGGIRLIAGPDLATATIEPHEFLNFLSGRLARQFIDEPQTLDLRISEINPQPDYDGQFRVSDFFCYDDTWRLVLSRLVGKSDVVLMDLRGFSPQNAGVIFEINELINMMPLERVLFIVDDTTDEAFLRPTLQQSWDRMKETSPNRLSKTGLLRLFRLENLRDHNLQRLLHALSMAAKPA